MAQGSVPGCIQGKMGRKKVEDGLQSLVGWGTEVNLRDRTQGKTTLCASDKEGVRR